MALGRGGLPWQELETLLQMSFLLNSGKQPLVQGKGNNK